MLTRLKSALLLFAMAFRYVFARASFGDSMAMFLESGSLGPLQRRQALRVLIDLEVEASQNLAEDCHLRPAPGAIDQAVDFFCTSSPCQIFSSSDEQVPDHGIHPQLVGR